MKHAYAFLVLALVFALGTIYSLTVPTTTSVVAAVRSIDTAARSETTPETIPAVVAPEVNEPEAESATDTKAHSIAARSDVPFYSQFTDIRSPEWKKVGCGVASLAMVIDYYRPGPISVDSLLERGVAQGAYLSDAGWTYKGLIRLGGDYDLTGESYDLAPLGASAAFSRFKTYLDDGPVIASVHYEFDPASTIPHLVVINRIDGDTVYYNDPAAKGGNKTISTTTFLKAWKQRFIVIRPA